ncbi:hypothetical protein RchiOBHm_Chr6g0265151 [Rosa chinensis]|uniref:Uncharacterized protein n=1 Tax=Rosa chinensis TaxID=74649 RepID=A0A2P6PPE9_ROSCH|nr:hypothetical protein RchiOBHm_Chr6g0265151 [Rosa chinensis]
MFQRLQGPHCGIHKSNFRQWLIAMEVLMQLSSSQPCCSFNSFCSREQNPYYFIMLSKLFCACKNNYQLHQCF